MTQWPRLASPRCGASWMICERPMVLLNDPSLIHHLWWEAEFCTKNRGVSRIYFPMLPAFIPPLFLHLFPSVLFPYLFVIISLLFFILCPYNCPIISVFISLSFPCYFRIYSPIVSLFIFLLFPYMSLLFPYYFPIYSPMISVSISVLFPYLSYYFHIYFPSYLPIISWKFLYYFPIIFQIISL